MARGSVVIAEAVLGVLRGTAFPVANTGSLFIALYDDAGAEVGAGLGYARYELAKATGSWSAPAGTPRAIHNVGAIPFGPATAAWGTVAEAAVLDTGGAVLYRGDLITPKTIGLDDSLSFAATKLELSEE